VVFVALLAVLLPLTTLTAGWSGWEPVAGTTAAVAGGCARAVGFDATATGNIISLPSRALRIDLQCTAVTLMAVYIALVLAYPVSWKMRMLAIAVGVPVLLAFNILRLVGVVWASELFEGDLFNIVHDYIYNFGMVFVVLMMWAVWLSFVSRDA